jgi:hypothetical protein
MEPTRPEIVFQFLRELGQRVPEHARLEIRGAIALIMAGILTRRTEDIDTVDEVPAPVRKQHALLEELAGRYGLHVRHFQSHYLPDGWRDRLHSLGTFGSLDVFVVDAVDVFVGKLFSRRTKDLDDLRAIAPKLAMTEIRERFRRAGAQLRAEPQLAQAAANNWYVLFGQALPQ